MLLLDINSCCVLCSCFLTVYGWNLKVISSLMIAWRAHKILKLQTKRGGVSSQRRVQGMMSQRGRSEWCNSGISRKGGEEEKEGEREKGSCPDKFLCIFLQSYTNSHRAYDWLEASWKPTCWRRRSEGKDEHRFVSCCAWLMTPSNINTF